MLHAAQWHINARRATSFVVSVTPGGLKGPLRCMSARKYFCLTFAGCDQFIVSDLVQTDVFSLEHYLKHVRIRAFTTERLAEQGRRESISSTLKNFSHTCKNTQRTYYRSKSVRKIIERKEGRKERKKKEKGKWKENIQI